MTAVAAPHLSRHVAGFVHALSYDQLPEIAVQRAKLAILDTVGVALAGADGDIGRTVVNYARRQGGAPVATVFGAGLRTTALWAAFANATLAHALDYDDTNYGMNGHLSSVLVPVVLALGEQSGSGGRAAITAYVAGFEVGSRLGRDMNPEHYESGWHSTATVGHIAAVAAACKLLGLGEEPTRMALGVAASAAGGLRANIGSMTKPLHSGLAAKSGVLAAELAAMGWTAAEDGLGARFGFTEMFAPGKPVGPALADLGHTWDIDTVWVAQKPYPSCAATHRAIDAVLALRAEHGFRSEEVDRVDCGVDYMVPTYMVYPEPRTPEEARFSMEYTLAAAVQDGQVGLEQYALERLGDPRLRELGRRVRMYIHPEEAGRDSWKVRFVQLDVHLREGRVLSTRVYEQRGHPNNPMSAAELEAKYRDAAVRALTPEMVETSLGLLRNLDRLDSLTLFAAALAGAPDHPTR